MTSEPNVRPRLTHDQTRRALRLLSGEDAGVALNDALGRPQTHLAPLEGPI